MALEAAERTTTRSGTVNRLGAVGFWGGIAGAFSALVLIIYPASVSPDHFSYPFDPTGFTAAQVFFSLQHVTMIAVIVALLRVPGISTSRLVKGGLVTGVSGLVLMSLLELGAITAAHSVAGEPLYDLVQGLYGIPTVITGIGLTLGGIGILRTVGENQLIRALPLILGVYVFVALIPAIMGPQVVARIGIGTWLLLFGLLGWTLWRGRYGSGTASDETGPGGVGRPR